MFVGALELRFDLGLAGRGGARVDKKHKRSRVASLIRRLRDRFEVSVAEVADQDRADRMTIGVSAVSGDATVVDSVLARVRDAAERHLLGEAELVEAHLEIMNVSFEHRRP